MEEVELMSKAYAIMNANLQEIEVHISKSKGYLGKVDVRVSVNFEIELPNQYSLKDRVEINRTFGGMFESESEINIWAKTTLKERLSSFGIKPSDDNLVVIFNADTTQIPRSTTWKELGNE